MTTTYEGLEFDPGFAQYILAFRGTVEYLYFDINKFKNLSQKKMRFRQYHNKILEVFYNNLGFYAGCLMWAAYTKTQPEQKILSNHCYGQSYNEEENTSETQYMLKFEELYPKDMKYYLAEDFSFDKNLRKLLEMYEKFLIINEGFTKTELNTDIKLPDGLKTDNAKNYRVIIEKVLENGNLSELLEYLPEIL